ncbi:exopolysaccharide biosynthesis protein [Palleronia abyssalis]|uniref:Exopolysaccharide synthesis, ExoD n=1 Tax=Palleronia abyssalis TaxID=1501240 RepID=A0A2R8C0F6_9RHOB|nr:exopolysaccharide biosynthesis protein [Palleronia abyssalis]SPJ25869.1 hypothetical protein PAA8504_03721 [Palleronia abyssalis]
MKQEEGAMNDVVVELGRATDRTDGDHVSVGNLIDSLDERGYGAILGVLPLLELSPAGAIPGFPTILALTLAITTVRLLVGYEHLWAPAWLRRRSLSEDRVRRSLQWLKPVALRIDAKLHERLSVLTGRQAQQAACIVILCLLAMVPFLEVIPFATSAPMIAIAFFGLAILFKDGAVMLLAFISAGVAAGVALWLALDFGLI